MRIVISSDHCGVVLKPKVIAALTAAGHQVHDLGVDADAGEVDYPPLCATLCDEILAGNADGGIVIGGSGSGESIVCNRRPGIRAGIAWSTWATEISRGNNDSNVMLIPAKALDDETALELVDVWLRTPFKGGVHAERLAQIEQLDRIRAREAPPEA